MKQPGTGIILSSIICLPFWVFFPLATLGFCIAAGVTLIILMLCEGGGKYE